MLIPAATGIAAAQSSSPGHAGGGEPAKPMLVDPDVGLLDAIRDSIP